MQDALLILLFCLSCVRFGEKTAIVIGCENWLCTQFYILLCFPSVCFPAVELFVMATLFLGWVLLCWVLKLSLFSCSKKPAVEEAGEPWACWPHVRSVWLYLGSQGGLEISVLISPSRTLGPSTIVCWTVGDVGA